MNNKDNNRSNKIRLKIFGGVLFLITLFLITMFFAKKKVNTMVLNGKVIQHSKIQTYQGISSKNSQKVFEHYIKKARQDPNATHKYRTAPKPLIIVVHKTGCSHCITAEPIITAAAREELPIGTNLLTINVAKGIPDWLSTIKGIKDHNGELHTPTILVTQLVPAKNHWEWVTLDRYTGTDRKQIRHVFDIKKLNKLSAVDVATAKLSTDKSSEYMFNWD